MFECLQKSSTIKKIGGKNGCSLWKVIDGDEVECPKCDRLFPCEDDEYYKHMRDKHFFGKFTCPSGCDIKADYAKDLVRHMQEEGHQEEHFAGCPLCEELIPIQELEPHYVTCVSANLRQQYVARQVCPTCGKQVRKRVFRAHMKSHLCKLEPSAEESKTTLQHYCDQCEKCYASKGALTDHIKAEHEGIVITCQLCPEKFKTRNELWQHKNLQHSTDERFNCKYCGKRYGSTSELRRHMRTHQDPTFSCKHCDKKFVYKAGLSGHERTHTGEKPYTCPVESCGKRWVSGTALAKHKRQVHNIFARQKNQK